MIDKEIRALLPAWIACAVALLATTLGVYPLEYFSVPVYFIAVAALGAFSIGHEFTYGTLGSVLTLPVPRRRIWATKLGVLLPFIATLAIVAAWRVNLDSGDRTFGQALFWLPGLASLFVAPWLTILSRSPLAGAVFTIALIGGSLAAGEWIGIARYGYTHDVDAFRRAFLSWSVGALSLFAAVAGWRAFSALEVSGVRGDDVQLLAAPSGARAGRRRPLVALVWKELRLQQLAIVVAVIYLAALVGLTLAGHGRREVYNLVSVLSLLYMMVLPIVIGSLGSAEERHFGTHDAQLLLPATCAQQWIVKVGTALGLVLVFGWLLPLAVSGLWRHDGPIVFDPGGGPGARTAIQLLAFASISLYVSTLARNGLSAMMFSIAAIVVGASLALPIGLTLAIKTYTMVRAAGALPADFLSAHDFPWIAAAAIPVIVVLRLAFANYRYADHSVTRVAAHAAITAACIAACAVAFGAVEAFIG